MRTIVGIGTLLSKASAVGTCPSMINYRKGKVGGYKRVFNKVDPFHKTKEGLKIANISVVEDQESTLIVSIFEISEEDWDAILYREFEYNFHAVSYEDEFEDSGQALICGAYQNNDTCMTDIYSDPTREEAYKHYCSNYTGKLWRDDILPNPDYIRKCIEAASTLGNDVVENFLETTWLADGSQNIKQYIQTKNES